MVERQTSTPLMLVHFPGAARDFSLRVSFQCRLSYSSHTPTCATTCIDICVHVKDLGVHVSLMDYGNTETLSMRSRLGRATVIAGFPQGKHPKFPRGEIPVGQNTCKKRDPQVAVFMVAVDNTVSFISIVQTCLPLRLYRTCSGKSSKSLGCSRNTDSLSKVPDSVIHAKITTNTAFLIFARSN